MPETNLPPEDVDTNPEDLAVLSEASDNVDILPGVEQQLRLMELQAQEHHDAWLRAKAETENVRRRAQDEVAKASKFAIEKFAADLLSVKDSLEQALALEGVSTPEAIKEGLELTLGNLTRALEKNGVYEVNPLGEKFDPHKHQALSVMPSDEPHNIVLNVLQKGYLLDGRVLRPAMVVLSNGTPAS